MGIDYGATALLTDICCDWHGLVSFVTATEDPQPQGLREDCLIDILTEPRKREHQLAGSGKQRSNVPDR